MKSILFFAYLLLLSTAFGQTFNITSGNDIEVPNRQRFLRVIHADETGSYVLEDRYKNLNFAFNDDKSQTIYRLDNNNNLVYQKNLDKDLGKKFFGDIKYFDGHLYIFCPFYSESEKKYSLSVFKLSAKDGLAASPAKEIVSVSFLTKDSDRFTYTISPAKDNKGLLVALNQSTDKGSKMHLIKLGTDLSAISLPPITYLGANQDGAIEDVMMHKNDIVCTIRNYDVMNDKKKTRYLKDFTIVKYSEDGQKKNELIVAVKDKFVISSKLLRIFDDQVLLAGFFTDEIDGNEVKGVFTNSINLSENKVTNAAIKPITRESLGYAEAGDKKAAKGMDGNYIIKDLVKNLVTGNYVLVSERTGTTERTSNSYNRDLSKGFVGMSSTSTSVFFSLDILVTNIDKAGNIGDMKSVVKDQREKLISFGTSPYGYSYDVGNAFSLHRMLDYPFYSSFVLLPGKKALHLIFNDHPKNLDITGPEKKYSNTYEFDESKVFVLSMDYTTGKFIRKQLEISNSDLALMPKAGFVAGNKVYVVGNKSRNLGKGEFRMNKIILREE